MRMIMMGMTVVRMLVHLILMGGVIMAAAMIVSGHFLLGQVIGEVGHLAPQLIGQVPPHPPPDATTSSEALRSAAWSADCSPKFTTR